MLDFWAFRFYIVLCGILYPGYKTFKTVRARIAPDFIEWTLYWFVFTLYVIFEKLADIFLCWLPFYDLLKFILILWILPTVGNGSNLICKNFISLLYIRNVSHEEHLLEELEQQYYVWTCIKYSVLNTARSVMIVINKYCPTYVLQLLARANVYNSNTSVQVSSDIIDEGCQNNLTSSKHILTRDPPKNTDEEMPQIPRLRYIVN